MSSPLDLAHTNLYTVLGLPSPTPQQTPTTSQIKVAFRRALLLHHPDKSHLLNQTPQKASRQTTPSYRVDAASSTHPIDLICAARDILTNSTSRREYDQLLQQGVIASTDDVETLIRSYPTELDTVDLDDMNYSETAQAWTRACRCGNNEAYEITEADLEYAAAMIPGGSSRGELLVGCGGCSLHIKVVFEALDSEAEDGDAVG